MSNEFKKMYPTGKEWDIPFSEDVADTLDTTAVVAAKVTAKAVLDAASVQTLTVAGANAIAATTKTVILNNATGKITATIAALNPGQTVTFYQSDAGTQAHTVTFTGGTFNAATNNVATFNAAKECLTIRAIDTLTAVIITNIGAVALS